MKEWHGFKAGDKIVTLIETIGATPNDEEITYPVGTTGVIDAIAFFSDEQGHGVHVVIGEGDQTIVNAFDDRDVRDEGLKFFRHADPGIPCANMRDLDKIMGW